VNSNRLFGRRQRNEHNELSRDSQLSDQRSPYLNPHEDQQQNHAAPLPSRLAQTLQSPREREQPTWCKTAQCRRFSACAQAGNGKKAGEQDLDEQCRCTHAASFEARKVFRAVAQDNSGNNLMRLSYG
jgi:hypothetical protein